MNSTVIPRFARLDSSETTSFGEKSLLCAPSITSKPERTSGCSEKTVWAESGVVNSSNGMFTRAGASYVPR